MLKFKPFNVFTCEALLDEKHRARCYRPNQDNPLSPFEIYDPFGLRNAIVPVFRQNADGRIYGLGTAFHIDGFGSYLTAYHVIDFIEHSHEYRPVLLLSLHAVVFGTVGIPPDCFVAAAEIIASMTEVDDPIAALQGRAIHRPTADVATLNVQEISQNVRPPHTLPVRAHGWNPRIGEIVLAIGFPELNLSEVDELGQREVLTEGMYGAYGRIIEVHPNGISNSNKSPVFVVESDWPSGMSGGPVFNRNGEVVGIVSRSLRDESGGAGVGYAVYFGLTQNIERLVPTLDMDNPGWRLCWGVFADDPYTPISMHVSREDAEVAAKSPSQPCCIRKISNRIGSKEFVEHTL